MKVCKAFDYFTAGTIEPSSLKVSLPLGEFAPVVLYNNRVASGGALPSGTALKTFESAAAAGGIARVGTGTEGDGYAYADLSQASAATIDTLKAAVSTEHYLEKLDNYCGDYYNGVLRGIYGTSNGDLNTNRPEHLGSCKFNINVNQVTAMADTTQNGGVKPAGSSAAVSITGNKSHLFHKAVSEHGYIMILGFARVRDQVYSQGIDRDDSKVSPLEFFNPYFTFLSDQEIKNKELYLNGDGNDDKTFAFQESWAEYRYSLSKASGYMDVKAPNTIGKLWSYATEFPGLPVLNESWISENRDFVARTLTTGTSSPYDYFAEFRIDITETSTVGTAVLPGTRGNYDSYNNPYDNGSWNWLTDLFNGGKRNQYDQAAGINPYLLLQNGFGSPGNYSYQVGKNEEEPYKFKANLLQSKTLNKIWNKGFITIGDVTPDSCAYVAGYVNKKIDEEKKELFNAGVKNMEELYPNNKVIVDNKIQNVDTVFTQLLLILPDLVRVAETKFSEPGSVSGMSAKDAAGTYGEQIITAIESILESPTKTNKED
ncbi:unnamed protein product [Cylicocyclus nassatus]|nr:unnamed protein product [Cylicocyclus nassatus]